ARVFALGGDQPDLDGDAAVAERRNAHAETVAELERLDQVLSQIEMDPHVVEIDQGHQRHAGRDVFAGVNVALVDLRGAGRVADNLSDGRLPRLDVGERLADICHGDLVLFFGVAVDRLLVGRFRLVDGALAFV